MLKTNLLCPARLRVGLMAVLAMLVGLGSAFAQRPKTANPRQPHVAAQPVERIEPFATPLMLEIQKNALMLSDDQMGRRVIAGCWNGDIMDLASYPPYASFFVDYKRAGNEFQRNRIEKGLRDRIQKEHQALLAVPYLGFNFHRVKMAEYSFTNHRFPFPRGIYFDGDRQHESQPPFGSWFPAIDNLNDGGLFPDIAMDEASAERFSRACPGREVDLTFFFENKKIRSTSDKIGAGRPFFHALANALFCVISYPAPSVGNPTRKVLGVFPTARSVEDLLQSQIRSARQVMEKLGRPADLKDKEDIKDILGKDYSDYFLGIADRSERCKSLGVALAPETQTSLEQVEGMRQAWLQKFTLALQNQRWHKGEIAQSGYEGTTWREFSISLTNYDPGTGVASGKVASGKEVGAFKGSTKSDAHGPKLVVNGGLMGPGWMQFEFRMRGDNQFCGVTSGNNPAYFTMSEDDASPIQENLKPSDGKGKDRVPGKEQEAAPAKGGSPVTGAKKKREGESRGLKGLLDRFSN